MKDYFTNNEIDDLLFTSYLIERNTELVDEWGARGNLTKEEAKYLRTAVTYTKKFLTATMERMPMKQVEKFTLRPTTTVRTLGYVPQSIPIEVAEVDWLTSGS